MPIAIIDYKMGNLRSVQKGFEKMGFDAVITDNPDIINKSSGIVVPGVGAFDEAIKNLKKLKLDDEIKNQIIPGKPFLGICLGLQLLFESSEEGKLSGLGILKGKVKKLRGKKLKVPQIGWNQVKFPMSNFQPALPAGRCPIFNGIPNNSFFYFVHSYYVEPKDKSIIAATTDYGTDFTSVIAKDNIFGVQFHPEKSSALGLQILKNFGELCSK